MADVAANDQRLVEEYVLRFLRRNAMPIPVLLSICIVPIKSHAAIQKIVVIRHIHQYTMVVYSISGGHSSISCFQYDESLDHVAANLYSPL